jgi:hypothetical protein
MCYNGGMTDRPSSDTATTATGTGSFAPYSPSLEVDPERIARLEAMTAAQRLHSAKTGQLTLGELLRWAARHPHEVPLVNGEFFFIAQFMPDAEPAEGPRKSR